MKRTAKKKRGNSRAGFLSSWSRKQQIAVGCGFGVLIAVNAALYLWQSDEENPLASALTEVESLLHVGTDSAMIGESVAFAETTNTVTIQPATETTAKDSPLTAALKMSTVETRPSDIQKADVEAPVLPNSEITDIVSKSNHDHSAGGFDRAAILTDHKQRINDAFSIPEGLKDRAGFWFDVYSKFDETKRIIHHSRYPWIVYKVVDVSEIINAPTPRRRWMRNMKADKLVDSETAKIRGAIKTVAARGISRRLSPAEASVAAALKALGGNVQKQAKLALGQTRVQVGQKNFFENGLRVSPRYLETMEHIFASRNLPIELTRLPFVESSFNDHATSKVGAAGIWQFMGNTGRKFMRIDAHIDERRSPFKASEAAARLLKENHLIMYRSWPLALTAYNHGPGGVRKAVKKTGSKDLAVIVRKYQTKRFDFASMNFYCEFLGALHAQMYKDEIWGNISTEAPLHAQMVRLAKSYRPNHLMKLTGLSADQFLIHNPDLRLVLKANRPLPKGFRLYIPTRLRSRLEPVLARADFNERNG